MSRRDPSLVWTPHAVVDVPDAALLHRLRVEFGEEGALAKIREIWERREKLIAAMEHDPLRHGYEPEPWKLVRRLIAEGFNEIVIMGANREGKTEFPCKLAMEMMTTDTVEVAFFHNTETTSVNQQQKRLFKYLPGEWKDAALRGNGIRENGGYIKYSAAGGFANNKLIIPGTGSTGYFWNYLQRSEVWEGPEYQFMWFDERVTLPILETARYRLAPGRRLIRIVTFTPKWGYSPVVQNVLANHTILETRRAALLDPDKVHVKGCPPGHMPYLVRGSRPDSVVVFFHNQMNAMGAGKEVAEALIGAPSARIMIRGYGWAEKGEQGAFAKFGDVHLVTRERFDRDIAPAGGTRYCVADPGGQGKNWFIKWYFVTPDEHRIVYREWPDFQHYEEWARSPADLDEDQEQTVGRKHDWRPGPAQRMEKGRGMADYRRLILTLEGWVWDPVKQVWDGREAEPIQCRLIDPRMGGAGIPSQAEGTSIIEMMEEPVMSADGKVELVPSMFWEAAPASQVAETVQMIEDAMAWEETQKLGIDNCPSWYVVDDLEQSKLAYREYTGLGTLKDSLKDIIDPDRYFIKSGYGHVDEVSMQSRGGTYY